MMAEPEIIDNPEEQQPGMNMAESKIEIPETSENQPTDEQRKVEDHLIKLLYQAAWKGDWNTARDIYLKHPDCITARISQAGDTALHIAAAAEAVRFARNLVDYKEMRKEHLAITNDAGDTAFSLVAASGKVELAEAMLNKNQELAIIPGGNYMLPLETAAMFGHKRMVEFLYYATTYSLDEEDRIYLFFALIKYGFYDIALDLLEQYPELATAREGYHEDITALHILARMPTMFPNGANQNQPGILKKCFNLFSGINKLFCTKLPPEALELVKHLWKKAMDLDKSQISDIMPTLSRLMFDAAEQGNIEFLTIIIREYPELVLKVNENNHSIFHIAVLNRHNDVFKLVHEIRPLYYKKSLLQIKDNEGNNILHLAGMLAPADRLNIVSGVALQLQQELLWFQEVRKIVHPRAIEAKNKNMKTPRTLFAEEHKELKKDGEKWMKQTANSCMIVATLIATVVFAAAFTLPGGTKEEKGTPHFIQKVSFKIFVIADALSLVSSCCSILTFLSILTSRYADEDFLSVLPRKLILGLATLLSSMAAMMVVFCATIFIAFKDGSLWVPILVAVIAFMPVILFIKQQLPLLADVVSLTFKSDSLFQSSKHTLLYDEEKAMEQPKKWNDFLWLFIKKPSKRTPLYDEEKAT